MDILCHRFKSIELNTIPKMAKIAVMENKTQPHKPLIRHRHMGMYEPRIIRKIEQWSKIWKTRFAFVFVNE